ncbi:hypothetical protein [Mycolicibacterium fortuitum]|uniref:Uncharacterized protein n=1 Tax=Mycobacterium phage Bipper TaxID=1805457 RepID=A0A142F2M5_9CAUD|nr:hypothetical protein [Mycolicibacterium fortuitum]YP_009303244.1 hypothetical protein KCH39_gp080 [Mycobacterium phage Bipper]AMQ67032.1 hypothetical protein SEA_BIPPER_97 [Mycobacterium phage Bipper]QDF19383.1 hypothetical protein SEA_CRACKLEWINK_97 [Mycobacterium phage Cracklewink]UBV14836.1 hypothetical protein H8Z57_29775 [Mycolicibacterium fortuitum]
MTHQADIAAILAAHQFHWGRGGTTCRGSGCDWRGGYRPAHERHVAELIDAALHPRIETLDQLAEYVDQHGHEIVVLDANGNAWQGVYDMSPDDLTARVLYTPGAGR